MGEPDARTRSDERVQSTTPPTVGAGKSLRIPSLDGMRGIGVILVFTTHIALYGRDSSSRFVVALHQVGLSAVGMFLVVSGFLITLILIKEKARTGRISLRRFYLRRVLRLWPALWVLLIVTAFLGTTGTVPYNSVNISSALFFVTNYVDQQNYSILAHTWSLALEEQFYLIWPLVIIVAGRARLPVVLTALILVAPFVRIASYFLLPGLRAGALYQFHNRYDAMACGCLLAIMWGHQRVQKFLQSPGPWGWIAGVGLLIPVAGEQVAGERFMLVAGYSMQAVSLAVLIGLAVTHYESVWGRLLNNRVIVQLGLMSYSLYLWQQMFLLNPWGWLKFWPLGLLAALIAGTVSYYLLEKPFIKLMSSMNARNKARAQ